MKLSLLPLLACPACAGGLRFARLEHMPHGDVDLPEGALACERCAREYPILDGVPRLLPPEGLDRANLRTRESFAWEWLRYPGALPEDRAVFLEETQLAPEAWAGRRVLDAGCGMGRYARVARSLGAETVAFDLSDGLLRLVEEAAADPGLHVVQGDILHPPFKPGVFDAVYSVGVIHHTPSAEGACRALGKLVKPEGLMTIWVYGRPGSWGSFSTNPLRGARAWLKRVLPLVWLTVWARMLLSDALRLVTTLLPTPLLYLLCHPLAALGALPLLKYLTFSVHRDYAVRLQENFDWLAPPYQSKHTKEELERWFADGGFTPLSRLAHGVVPKPGLLGRKKAAR
ncbi:MAG: methyltransferase domain-containing protein [Elusimicrobiota bacterium]|jgi:SAM-dependent methyltransferase